MPLQRHSALTSLSRDHHLALQLARGVISDGSPLLRAELPKDTRTLCAHVHRVFTEELEDHFQAEESVVIPAIKGRDAELDALCVDIESQHVELRSLAAQLGDATLDEASALELLDRFGRLLESHVRAEERVFYQRIQDVLGEKTLKDLGAQLERHLHAPHASR